MYVKHLGCLATTAALLVFALRVLSSIGGADMVVVAVAARAAAIAATLVAVAVSLVMKAQTQLDRHD